MFGLKNDIEEEKTFEESLEEFNRTFDASDDVIIGAGSGLSTAAGYRYSGEIFDTYFRDFKEKYGIRDMYSGGFYPFPSLEEYYGWWSRHIWLNRYSPIPSDLYERLLDKVKAKNYFILTTNVDHCFQRAGFDKERLFYTQGDYGLFQSRDPGGASKGKTYDNKYIVKDMLLSQGFSILEDGTLLMPETGKLKMTIDTELIPYCPDDGKEMVPNLRSDDTFVEDAGWHEAAGRYGDFLAQHGISAYGFFTADGREKVDHSYDGKVLFLELGVGANTPGIIKYPFWRMTFETKNATYVAVNKGEVYAPKEIMRRSILIDGDIGGVF